MNKRKIFAFAVPAAVSAFLLLAGCAESSSSGAAAGGGRRAVDSPVAGKRVAYIMQMAPSDIFTMWSESAKETANALGMGYDAFYCGGSDSTWQDTVYQCAAAGYDGLLLSHGGASYSYSLLMDVLDQFPDTKIATFDTSFIDLDGNIQKIAGVTQFFQQDAGFSELLLEYILNDLYPEKSRAGIPVNIVKIWIGPGFVTAFDRRQVGYEKYERSGQINTLETIAPSDLDNPEASMAEVATATLAKYRPGEIDAFWCAYDLYANGVYAALTQGGYDIPLVSVDISDADIEKMAAPGSPWKACATTNWHSNGEFGIRVLALEMAGEYNRIVDPLTGAASDWLEIPTAVVTQDMVSGGGINVGNLDTVAGSSYSDKSWMPTTDWMARLLGS